MAKQTIGIGTTANDGTGDGARTAFDKVNDNFNEVYGVSGLLKSNGSTTLSAAVADTDYQSVPSEGAFADGDKTKLDSIEANADVTDETNVTGALDGATLTDVGTPASGDKILLQDASDSSNLKTALFSEFGGGGGGGGGLGIFTNLLPDNNDYVVSMVNANNSNSGNGSVAADRLYFMPLVVGYDTPVDEGVTYVQAAGTATESSIFLYAAGSEGYPTGSPLASWTAIDVTATGNRTASASYTLAAGTLYWIAIWADGTLTSRGPAAGDMLRLSTTTTSPGNGANMLRYDGATYSTTGPDVSAFSFTLTQVIPPMPLLRINNP